MLLAAFRRNRQVSCALVSSAVTLARPAMWSLVRVLRTHSGEAKTVTFPVSPIPVLFASLLLLRWVLPVQTLAFSFTNGSRVARQFPLLRYCLKPSPRLFELADLPA